jgi:hypothetical protein
MVTIVMPLLSLWASGPSINRALVVMWPVTKSVLRLQWEGQEAEGTHPGLLCSQCGQQVFSAKTEQ